MQLSASEVQVERDRVDAGGARSRSSNQPSPVEAHTADVVYTPFPRPVSCVIRTHAAPRTKLPRGVSRVETQLSFLNGLVSVLTFSIFTPVEITVTCGQ